ncbi:MAG: hypothetical protein HY722_00890 [Planctomycetes bacterium]|nr:hypothetical protein [Planctomycetota bacterium]
MSVLGPRGQAFLWALTLRLVPPAAGAPPEERARSLAVADGALGRRPPAVRRQVRLFLLALRWLPALGYLRPLDRLGGPAQDRVLAWFQDSPLTPLALGLWGVKGLVYMGWYGRPELGERIGFRPVLSGDEKSRGG